MSADTPLQYSSLTTADTDITAATIKTWYYGCVVASGTAATAVLIKDGGSSGTIVDTFEVAANASQAHLFKEPVLVRQLHADVDANTQQCIVYYHEET